MHSVNNKQKKYNETFACVADIFNGWWSSQFLVVVPVQTAFKQNYYQKRKKKKYKPKQKHANE